MSPLDTALEFVARINAHDVAGLAALMAPDHRFIDSLGSVVTGRGAMQEAWRRYFQMIPDYHIEVSRSLSDESGIALFGRAQGSYNRGVLDPADAWEIPAAWRAIVRDGLVSEWQVYADNEPLRRRMARASG